MLPAAPSPRPMVTLRALAGHLPGPEAAGWLADAVGPAPEVAAGPGTDEVTWPADPAALLSGCAGVAVPPERTTKPQPVASRAAARNPASGTTARRIAACFLR